MRDTDREKFRSILAAASGWNHNLVFRVAIVAIIVLVGHSYWRQELASQQVTAWYGKLGVNGIAFTLAGQWFVRVANPIFQYLHLLWMLRLLMFAVMLARVAALDLHLVATHPVATQMRIVPFSNRVAIEVVVFFLLPIAPLLLTVFPAEQMLDTVIRALLN